MIKRIVMGIGLVMGMATVAMAGAKEDVQAAAKKLEEGGNYSWTSKTEGNFTSTSEGKMQGGVTMLKMSVRDNTIELYLKDGKGAIKTEDGWMSLADAAGDNGPQGPARFVARMAQNYKSPAKNVEEAAGQVKELNKADDAYTGELSDDAVKQQLRFGRGNNGPELKNAKGSVKFWVKDGVLSKAQVHIEGTITFNGEDRDLNRTTTIEIKDVGSTKVEVPEEAKGKMG